MSSLINVELLNWLEELTSKLSFERLISWNPTGFNLINPTSRHASHCLVH